MTHQDESVLQAQRVITAQRQVLLERRATALKQITEIRKTIAGIDASLKGLWKPPTTRVRKPKVASGE